jgi:hypothetical protein
VEQLEQQIEHRYCLFFSFLAAEFSRSRDNVQLNSTVSSMTSDVAERATLHRVQLQSFGDGGAQVCVDCVLG